MSCNDINKQQNVKENSNVYKFDRQNSQLFINDSRNYSWNSCKIFAFQKI